ncbi:hypothetical protein NLJ89_g3235 [Agrocybe chaxingu]|uniref:Uncharacterized protein n=1 Tax=Agrocybe chaxingu TaxID=84603 RepID=A0A9W8KA61_9AGAR|nr:hypothetical protein NLJ89_g3235 [Agrocybe chaxingu]
MTAVPQTVSLAYTIAASTPHSGKYGPEHIMEDKPQDQSSRWSGAFQGNANQWMVLRLQSLVVLKTITFGKFSKPHPCNMKELKVFVGISEDLMTEVLHTTLKNDAVPEVFNLSHVNAAGIPFPTQYVKIVPLLAHGQNFHISIWHVAMTGIIEPTYVEGVRQAYEEYRETSVLRYVLKHLRQRRLLSPYQAILSRANIQLEHPLVTQLHESLVLQGNWARTEQLLEKMSAIGLFDSYLLSSKPHAVWTRITGTDADGDIPPARGGHAMCIDPENEMIYMFGGWNGEKNLDDFWVYDIKEDRWKLLCAHTTEEQNAPGPSSCHKMVFDTKTGCIYVLGRLQDADGLPVPAATSLPSRGQPMPTPSHLPSSHLPRPPATGSGPETRNKNLPSEFYRFHTRGVLEGKWDFLAIDTASSGGPPLISDHQMALDTENQIIYVFGGRVLDGHLATTAPKYSGLYSYHINTSKWNLLQQPNVDMSNGSPAIPSRSGKTALVNPGRYSADGIHKHGDKYLSDLYSYDTKTNVATEIFSNFSTNGGPDAGFTQRAVIEPIGKELYVLCGLTRGSGNAARTLRGDLSSWIYRYETKPGKWVQILRQPDRPLSEIPMPRFAHQVAYNPKSKAIFLHGGNAGEAPRAEERERMPAGAADAEQAAGEGEDARDRQGDRDKDAPSGSGAKERRLDDFWKMELKRPEPEEIIRQTKFLIRRQQFREMCEELPPVKALGFLQKEVASVVDHTNAQEEEIFRSLLTHLLSPPPWALSEKEKDNTKASSGSLMSVTSESNSSTVEHEDSPSSSDSESGTWTNEITTSADVDSPSFVRGIGSSIQKIRDVADPLEQSMTTIAGIDLGSYACTVPYGDETVFVPGKFILALLFRKIVNVLTEAQLWISTDAVYSLQAAISIPSWFDHSQQGTILEAAHHAGFDHVGLITDTPTIASIYNSLHFLPRLKKEIRPSKVSEHVLFVDIGHTSTTVALVQFTHQGFSIQNVEFNASLGGRDVDLALASHFSQKIFISTNFEINQSSHLYSLLVKECEAAKDALLFSCDADIRLYILPISHTFQASLTSEIIETVSVPFLQKLAVLIQDVVSQTGRGVAYVDTVVLSGPTAVLLKSDIADKFPVAVVRMLDKRSTTRKILSACTTMPTRSAPPSVPFWIGKRSSTGSVIWKKWKTDHENEVELASEMENMDSPSSPSGSRNPSFRHSSSGNVSQSVDNATQDFYSELSVVIRDIQRQLDNIKRMPETDPQWPEMCNNLCASYLKKYKLNGNINTLGDATMWAAQALGDVNFETGARPEFLANLANCLKLHYEQSGDLELLNRGILYQSYLLPALTEDTPRTAAYLINYGTFLQTRGEHLGHIPDLEEGAKHIQRAIGILIDSTTPSDVMALMAALSNLGNVLQVLYRWTGRIEDLHRMITCYESALSITKKNDAERASNLNHCGTAMMMHYKHFGDVQDAYRANQYFIEALQCIPDVHPSTPIYLGNYVNALHSLHVQTNDVEILNKAIEMNQKALRLLPENSPNKRTYISKQGNLLGSKQRFTKDFETLDKALQHQEEALNLVPEDKFMERFSYLNNVATTLVERFRMSRAIEDISKAMKLIEEGISLVDDGSDRSTAIGNLAKAEYEYFTVFRDQGTQQRCVKHCREVVNSLAPLTVRFEATKVWIAATSQSTNGPEAQEANTAAVDLLSQLAWPGLSLSSQVNVLRAASQTACNTAAAALHFGDVTRALKWLEQGRTIAWNQLLQIRSPLKDLEKQAPELARNITRLSQLLERGPEGDHLMDDSIPTLRVEKSPDFSRNAIALEREKLLNEARTLPGFENLMKGKEYAGFAAASNNGPIAVLNISTYRCDAIVMVSDRYPVNLPLEDFSLEQAENLRVLMYKALKESKRMQRGEQNVSDEIRFGRSRRTNTDSDADAIFRYILKELWVKVVQPVIDCLGIGVKMLGDMPHIYWCPTGPLTFLPLHAAGIYAADDDRETATISLLDYVVSSYTPSLSALHNIVYNSNAQRPQFKMLPVIQSGTPGQTPLPATLAELEIIRKYTGCFPDRIRVLAEEEAKIELVMSEMKRSSWIHLACHGRQDVDDPTKSGLHLHDGMLGLQDIIQNPLPNADFVFLSACQTASGDVTNPDEAIHLAAGMLLAGFNSVIASMWSIGDSDAAIVADQVYAYLFRDGKMPDSREAARALHRGARFLRAKRAGARGGSEFLSWVPFIHVGM